MWVFGYGSLVWRPAFEFEERRAGFLEGWSRRFWQGSTDHRGVPEAPGRVVTLVEEPGQRCWGIAYRVEPRRREDVLALLDHREQGGYERRDVTLWLSDPRDRSVSPEPVSGLVYLATQRNRNYLGPAPLESIAAQVAGAHGPSGSNVDYVLRLAGALRELGVEDGEASGDAHLFALERLVAEAGA